MKDQNHGTRKIEIVSSYELKQLLDEEKKPELFFKTKISSLDKAIEGFSGGELITISGPTKGGKTLLAQTLTHNFLEQQIYSLWFSFELPPKEFISRFPDLSLFYLPRHLKRNAVKWLHNCILQSLEENRTKAVFIDHLHFLFDIARTRNPSLEIGSIVRELKSLAVDNNIVIFLLCHTSKLHPEKEPDAESIRDSSFVGQESDSVFILWRVKDSEGIYGNKAILKVEYHRRTGVMSKKVKLQKIDGLLKEVVDE